MLYLGHKVEAFCFAVAEAQAMGVPCVVAPVAAVPERVIDGVTGYIHSDPQKFAEAALAILSDDALWRKQHEAALQLQQGLSWDEHAAHFEAAVMPNPNQSAPSSPRGRAGSKAPACRA
jgi:glycosyltransferase involved in cell wall biosynthesis